MGKIEITNYYAGVVDTVIAGVNILGKNKYVEGPSQVENGYEL